MEKSVTGNQFQFKDTYINKKKSFITNGNDKLYSAWWYNNGISHTTNQVEWALEHGEGIGSLCIG